MKFTWEPPFSDFLNPNGKNLDLQVKCVLLKKLPEGRTDFTGINFCYKFHKKTTFLAMLYVPSLAE